MTLREMENGRVEARSQLTDYRERGVELESYNFLQFTVDTYEEPVSKKRPARADAASGSRRGRPRNLRAAYRPGYDRAAKFERVVRSNGHNTLPNIVGPFFPRRDDTTKRDLKQPNETWEDAFQSWVAQAATKRDRDVMSNIQYLTARTRCRVLENTMRKSVGSLMWARTMSQTWRCRRAT